MRVRGGVEEPVAIETELGWVLSGPMKCKNDFVNEGSTLVNNLVVEGKVLGESEAFEEVRKLWDLDTLGITGEEVQEEFLDNITFNGRRYSVKLPWKANHKPLPTNYENSLCRLNSTLRKLRQEPQILSEYEAVISDQLRSGVIETVQELECDSSESSKTHYLPHRAVVRRNAETTKVRIVYDASSKTGKGGVSLNECLHVGPSLNPLLFDILLRFRIHKIGLIADIEKAFLNIEVDMEDRNSLRFLWPEDPRKRESPIRVYRFCRVVFGLNSSPFLLN